MKIVSLNVGMPREVVVGDKKITTGIFKDSTEDQLMVRKYNIDGDGQADLSVHGGEHKAVYSYAEEFYQPWQQELQRDLPVGIFGENLTTRGLDEESVCLGDIFRFGQATLQAVQPRQPCFKLGIRFEDSSIVKKFTLSNRWGIYYRVIKEGLVAADDDIELLEQDEKKIPVYEISRLVYSNELGERAERLLHHPVLPPNWQAYFQKRLSGA